MPCILENIRKSSKRTSRTALHRHPSKRRPTSLSTIKHMQHGSLAHLDGNCQVENQSQNAERWNESQTGGWTYCIIPDIRGWIGRSHGKLDTSIWARRFVILPKMCYYGWKCRACCVWLSQVYYAPDKIGGCRVLFIWKYCRVHVEVNEGLEKALANIQEQLRQEKFRRKGEWERTRTGRS